MESLSHQTVIIYIFICWFSHISLRFRISQDSSVIELMIAGLVTGIRLL